MKHNRINKQYHVSHKYISLDKLRENVQNMNNEIKNKAESMSTEMIIDKSIKTIMELEEKLRAQSMKNVEINVGINVGFASINISKKISLEE